MASASQSEEMQAEVIDIGRWTGEGSRGDATQERPLTTRGAAQPRMP